MHTVHEGTALKDRYRLTRALGRGSIGAGLVHRDLRPESVMIRRDGVTKIPRLRLVKLMSDDGPGLASTGGQVVNLL
ncbi:hypothetical protein [Streptomyces sp. NPDC015125]|uniref:hypothetical protein n=1 Tax=Streptomyces sp. NPDC015125 TaxID=3364938 RepID=UPI0036F4FB24